LEQFERFSDVLSHDLGTPLSLAKGRLEMALEEYESEHLRKANEALDRVNHLVEELASVMREGELVNEIEDVSLEETARRWGPSRPERTLPSKSTTRVCAPTRTPCHGFWRICSVTLLNTVQQAIGRSPMTPSNTLAPR